MDTIIKAQDLGKSFTRHTNLKDRVRHYLKKFNAATNNEQIFWALKNLSFEIQQGESVGILGLNGSGKSTLLQLIASILKPSRGSIDVQGRVCALLELGSGFDMDFSGKENIYFNASLLGLSKQEIDKQYEQIIEFAAIGDFINQPVRTYSSGMLMRLAFAVILHVEPDILIIDEALAVGDILFQQKCIRFLKERFATKTKIFVAHDLATISSLCTRVLCLDQGHLIYDGTVAEGIEYYLDTVFSKSRNQSSTSTVTPLLNPDWHWIAEDKLSGLLELKIVAIQVYVNHSQVNSWQASVVAQDRITIKLLINSKKTHASAIFGYLLSDHYGDFIFGQNCYKNSLVYELNGHDFYEIEYEFLWPDVKQGSYTLTPGIGEGVEALSHKIQCWAQNIFVFECLSSHAVHGIFNNPLVSFKIDPYNHILQSSTNSKDIIVHAD
ncbi:ABC transporter ATP-binding protein [Legionella pneumophila]|uniref:ABC transporter ATP-binding protein n=1 Tax=Legionella pneumophila TaxID=446 RepID=UPI0007785B2C|nr:ABC transporter ATP-binding protein [Legionella pneumophila]HAT8606377.1 ATP-binding cassette domain-containing protein [Legionella pneumophila]